MSSNENGQGIDIAVLLRDIICLRNRIAALEIVVEKFTSTNKQSMPCCPKCGKSDCMSLLWSCSRCSVDEG